MVWNTLLHDIRERGWLVAVHNDYLVDEKFHTFWLFTKDTSDGFKLAVKGEGRDDEEALGQVWEKVRTLAVQMVEKG